MQGDSLLESFKGFSLNTMKCKKTRSKPICSIHKSKSTYLGKPNTDLAALEKDFFDPKNNHRKEVIRSKIDELVAFSIEQSFKDLVNEREQVAPHLIKNISPEGSKERVKHDKVLGKLEMEIGQMQQALKDIKPLLKKDEKPWFLWHLFFKDVFDKGGFDIVIGNPPSTSTRKHYRY